MEDYRVTREGKKFYPERTYWWRDWFWSKPEKHWERIHKDGFMSAHSSYPVLSFDTLDEAKEWISIQRFGAPVVFETNLKGR